MGHVNSRAVRASRLNAWGVAASNTTDDNNDPEQPCSSFFGGKNYSSASVTDAIGSMNIAKPRAYI
jgi:hypothetical protein